MQKISSNFVIIMTYQQTFQLCQPNFLNFRKVDNVGSSVCLKGRKTNY